MNRLVIKLLKEFFTNPYTLPNQRNWNNDAIFNTKETTLVQSFGIDINDPWLESLQRLWNSIDTINYCVNADGTCTNCEAELDKDWHICANCANALCENCDTCCINDREEEYQCCPSCGDPCGSYMCRGCRYDSQ